MPEKHPNTERIGGPGKRPGRPDTAQPAGGDGLRGHDKQQASLRDADTTRGDAREIVPAGRSAHTAAQPGARIQQDALAGQAAESTPEGLKRERKGPYDKRAGRNENPAQWPNHSRPDRG